LKNFVIKSFLLALFASFLPMNQVAEALSIVDAAQPSTVVSNPGGSLSELRSVGSVETRYGLVAILVDEDVWSASTSEGGFFSFFGSATLKGKIQSYASDVQAALPWTKAVIVTVSDEDTPVEIQRLLEQFYFEGNPNDSDTTRLSGVVLVGDVPLPVVNKNGNRFISMLPYTDFEEPAYLLDSSTQDFLPNMSAQHLQAEVWHGVIVPPLDGQNGLDLLGAFFDKNHAFHTGDEDYTTFDQKAFIGDFVTEEAAINPTAYASYTRFTNLWEEITYYRYTNDLVEELYTDMQASIEAGDRLDNDGDGLYDEEALNGIDDDGDGLVDEDIGDGFFGIDNDGDCYELAESAQDSNGDGIPCFKGQYDEDGDEILPPDNLVDEDGFSDNNNDKDWYHSGFGATGPSETFTDRMTDEDPPGDTTGGEDLNGDGIPDGDGCPGLCGVDDNGDSMDHDEDGYPTGIELLYGTDPQNEKRPWQSVQGYVNDIYGESFSDAEDATAFLAEFFIDDFYGDYYQHPSCIAEDGSFHPEWDDDEDGFCDEDGSTEMQLWLNQNGTPASGTCAYNDGDCDGQIDEDPEGLRPEGMFDNLPDIQAKSVVENLTSRYAEMFEEPQGVWNRLVAETGRYKTRDMVDEDTARNDYDTAISLISKKDEAVLQYLTAVNTELESRIDAIVEDDLSEEIPLVASLQITGEIEVEDEDPEDICDPDGDVDLDSDKCLQFVNHSGFDWSLFDDEAGLTNIDQLAAENYFINGRQLWEVDKVAQCTNFAGTDEEDGQLAKFNSLYSRKFSEKHQKMNQEEVERYRNCVPEFEPYTDDIPEVCNTPTAMEPTRTLDGAKVPEELEDPDFDSSKWETGPEACFEFRELQTFNDYTQSYAEFSDWLTGKLRDFRSDGGDSGEDYEEFLEKVDEKREHFNYPAERTLRKNFSELDLLRADGGRSYTMIDLMEDLGYEDVDNEDIDTFIGMLDDDSPLITVNLDNLNFEDYEDVVDVRDNDSITINNPSHGSGMSDVESVTLTFKRTYIYGSSGIYGLSTTRELMLTIPSVYKHTEPTADTLNAQITNAGSPNLPIDKTRRISFIDNADAPQTIVYVNVFDAVTTDDVEEQINALAEDIADVEGGSSFKSEVQGYYDDLNEYQLADALAWRYMSIDEKHKYVLSHYLSAKEAITTKARDGYEMVSLIADGTATEMQFAFNGDQPLSEEDLEFQYRSSEAIEAALAAANSAAEAEPEPLTELSNTTPVLLTEWVEAIQEWLEEVEDSLSSKGSGEAVCGEVYEIDSRANEDSDGSGIPDGADATVALLLSSDDDEVLQANGEGSYVVSVSAKKSDGTINTSDNYTQVGLNIVSGTASIDVTGTSILQLTAGVATFTLTSAEEGNFVLKGVTENRDDVTDSNTLSGSVVTKFVKVSTYITEDSSTDASTTTEAGDRIEITNEAGTVVAVLDPESGDLDLRGASAELREADATLPTRIAVMNDSGTSYGVLYLIPEYKAVGIGSGPRGVFVKVLGTEADASKVDNGVALLDGDVQVGLVTDEGGITVADDYSLEFNNPGQINVYEPIHVLNSDGESVFTVTVQQTFDTGSIVAPEGEYSEYLTAAKAAAELATKIVSKKPGWSWIGVAEASSTNVPDDDEDLLDNLEEWVIGTLLDDNDTDSDGYLDGLEIFSGYDPLAVGKKLFTDIGIEHVAYPDLALLYLRGVIKGYSDGSFKPDNPITREEFIKIDLGAICMNCDSYDASYEQELMAEYNQDPFPDTNINPDLLACVAEAKVGGIVSGYAGGTSAGYYLPTRNISRAEATKVLVETAGYEVPAVSGDGAWYTEYVNTAKEHDLFPDGTSVTTAWLEGSITRAEFVMMAVNLIDDKDCRAVDTDGDGLSDTEEQVLYGTDPQLADTDGGGVSDLDEVLRGSDPLDASDDFPTEEESDEEDDEEAPEETEDFSDLGRTEHEPGLYAVSSKAEYEEIATSTGASSSSVTVFTSEVAADGESEVYVRAEIRDQDDNLYSDDNSSIIEFVLSSSDYGEIMSDTVQVSSGVAETLFHSSELSGIVTIEGRITDGSLPSENQDLYVYPGEPVTLTLSGESTVLPAGAQAAEDMTVYMYDSFGNLAANGFYTVTLSTEGGITLLDVNDEDTTTDGTQVTTADGYMKFRVLSSAEVETATVYATLSTIPDSGDSFTITHESSLALKVETTESYLLVGSSNGETINISTVDGDGNPVTGFQGDVELSLSDPAYGSFDTTTVSLVNGAASAELTPGTLAGTGSIIAESAGIDGGSAALTSKPASIYELRIRKEDGTMVMQAGEPEKFIIEGFDQYGNIVTTDSTTTGSLRLTDSTAEFGTLSDTSFALHNGRDTFNVTSHDVSGKISIVGASTGLLAGTWGGTVDYMLEGTDFADIQPQMLYVSLLGAPFGDVTQNNYIGGWMTFNGKTQAVTSLIAEPKPKKRLVEIDARGLIVLPTDGMVTQTVENSGKDLPTRIQWREFPDDTLLGEVFFVVENPEDITASLLTTDTDFELEQNNDGWLLREDSAGVAKVRSDGQIQLLDPSYSLVVNGAADGLGFAILKDTVQILRIDYPHWDTSATVVDSDFELEGWAALDPGVYLKPTASSENHIVAIPTGNSSLNPMGLAIVDPEEDLAKEMQPSLGYQSLEAAEDNGDIGWEGENKHLQLFAAGNTVGQSNLYYTSEVAVVLGDPTIKLSSTNEVGDLGFTQDLGTMVATSNDEVKTLMNLDYNGDGMQDVLAAYEDGRIEVLQNAKAAVRLEARGELLFIENGISSIDKGDFNNDGLDDLLIVTDEACFEGEVCLYNYENIGGGFVAENLGLTGLSGKPVQVEVGDLNNDDYDDLVIVDENMVVYAVWNAAGTLQDVTEIKDFGLSADPTQELYADIAVRYDGLENGSVSIGLLTEDLDEDSSVDGDLNAFLESMGVDEDFTATGTDTAEKKVNQAFEYADAVSVENLFSISKSVSDPSGGKVEVGDVLTYSITMTNVSGSTYSDLYLADSLGSFFTLQTDSIAASVSAELQEGEGLRPFIYGPFKLTNGQSITLTYDVLVSVLPNLQVMLAHDIYSDYKDDNYLDLAISPDGNTSGQLEVYYSDGYVTHTITEGFLGLGGSSYREISYHQKTYSPETYAEEYDNTVTNPLGDSDGDGIPDFAEDRDEDLGFPVPTDGSFDVMKEIMGAKDTMDADGNEGADGYYSTDEMYADDTDADNDGINDTVDNWVSGSDVLLAADLILSGDTEISASLEANIASLDEQVSGMTDKIENIVSMFTCNGGCLALPGSIAFLAPGNYHMPITGATVGFDPGTPVFGILPYLPVVCTGQMCYGSNVMRLYLAPTTTLGIGLGVCLGPYGAGQCFAFSIPLLQALGICDAINGFISDSLSSATAFVSNGVNAAFNVGDTVSVEAGSTGLESDVFTSYTPPVAANANIQVPGFPSIFTEWWKAQKEEFFKMLDLPDITFIYPDPKSLTTEFTGIREKAASGSVSLDGKNLTILDQEIKVEELNSGILGLEKWLNIANALPLIDIKPETVNIRYPALTAEEIEIIENDWQLWLKDTKDEWTRFKKQFDLRDNITAAQREVFDGMEATIGDAITAMEANLAVLESYKHIPEQILALRDIEAYYAKIIICYLDAILSHTAGYLKENVDRIEAWGQFIVDLKDIVDGWQVLIDLSVDLMDSCDKCTNQRYSGMQLLFSLFVFVPDFPVVEMPKLPDIVIDVSNIQAGVDIIWPDINFVPERINIPDIPRISLPEVNIKTDVTWDLDLNIPTLPEFPIIFELPELPALTLPDLPSLPPPPQLPELDPTISSALNIASNVLKIVCIIRQGFIPTPEMTLKSKIEEITERPGAIVLPFDTAITVEWPEFSFDFVKEIRVSTFLNLQLDFNALYDAVNQLGEQSNDIVTDFVQDSINKPIEELQDKIQSVLDLLGETSIDIEVETGVEGEVGTEGSDVDAGAGAGGEVEVDTTPEESSYNPAYETALAYKDNPLVMQNLIALRESMERLQTDFDAWGSDLPESVELTASQRTLALDDPLLNRYDEVLRNTDFDDSFLASIEDTPLASVLQLRDSLIAYTQDFEQGTIAMKGMDSETLHRYLAAENLHAQYLLASDEGDVSFSTGAKWHPENWVTPSSDSVELAAESGSAFDALDLGTQAQSTNEGMYIYNAETGISEKLLAYTAESDEVGNILFVDLDDDGDDDLVYSMGTDVYFKENHTESANLKYVSTDPETVSLADLAPDHGSVQNLKRGKNDYEEASFSFAAGPEATGYEVLMYDSLDAQQAEPAENVKRLLLLDDPENAESPLADEAGNDLGDLQVSRIVADKVNGKVKILNGYKRTLITANGEISETAPVTFQTIEDSVIEITLSESSTSIAVEAGSVLSFGQVQERTLRVDSGSVYWVDPGETVEEQDLEEGMEIFAEELVDLQSSGAKTTLLTSEGAELELDKEELFVMDQLPSANEPAATVELENGAYYTTTRSLSSDGVLGTISDNILLNPQVCADDSAPYVLVDDDGDTDGDGAIELAIFSTRELSAEGSFDSDSEIVDAYWDIDSGVDSDGDGISNNDQQVIGLTAEIGPYEDLNTRIVTVYVTDAAGNTSSQEITVEIYVPELTLTSATQDLVEGTSDPLSPNFPYHLIRSRSGALNEIGTGYSTDENGAISEEMVNSDLLSVYNAEGETIAQFNPSTKQLLVYDEDYDSVALSADADWPSRLAVYEKASGMVLGSFFFVTESAFPIQKVSRPLSEIDLSSYHQVTVYPVANEDDYEYGDDTVVARDEHGNLDFMITQSGNITVFDSRYTLVKKAADSLDEYLEIEVYDDGVLELAIWPGSADDTFVTTTDELDLPPSDLVGEHGSLSANTHLVFEDISSDDELYQDIEELVERGVLEGYELADGRYFKPDQEITRAEFTKIVLGILCIVPSDEAEALPAVFTDILDPATWYYAYTKESFLRDLITGYLGEVNSAGVAPFKPTHTITRAEAAKIILEALDKEAIITLPDDLTGVPWYAPYMEIAQDLTPYMNSDATAGETNFIVTAEEAADPGHEITRYEFVEMSVRVLKAYNCFDLDSDGDGLINYDEENKYGTDPYNPDTDGGGVDDGTEVGRSSDPLDGDDDFGSGTLEGMEPGIYAVREACSACPCNSNIDYDADLRPGDEVFAIIQNEDGDIFGVSNTLTVQE
jgi:uncharacterized repeat protein (TIGR01451 family)